MEKYKICPTCGIQNPPTMLECIECETDLTGVPIGEVLKDDGSKNQNAEQKIRHLCENAQNAEKIFLILYLFGTLYQIVSKLCAMFYQVLTAVMHMN